MSDKEVYGRYVEFNSEKRSQYMMEFTTALTSLLQSGVRVLYIGENTVENEQYLVCSDIEHNFVNFITIQMGESGKVTTSEMTIRNDEFFPLPILVTPIVINDCLDFEDFLKKAGIIINEKNE